MVMMLPLLAFVFGTALVVAAAYALTPARSVAIDRRHGRADVRARRATSKRNRDSRASSPR